MGCFGEFVRLADELLTRQSVAKFAKWKCSDCLRTSKIFTESVLFQFCLDFTYSIWAGRILIVASFGLCFNRIPISVEQAKLHFNWLNCFDHMWSPFSSIPTMHHTQLRFHKRSKYRIIFFYYYFEWSKKVMKPEMLTISAQWASSIHATNVFSNSFAAHQCRPLPTHIFLCLLRGSAVDTTCMSSKCKWVL